jgi:predicted CxxxxCH...CXXCH cytochrome family protein
LARSITAITCHSVAVVAAHILITHPKWPFRFNTMTCNIWQAFSSAI